MTDGTELLQAADATLRAAAATSNRLACWLSRSALESVVESLLRARGYDVHTMNMRTRLSCLEVAYEDELEISARAQYAWSRLSQACHQHAYQLDPTFSEADHLLSLVRRLAMAQPSSDLCSN